MNMKGICVVLLAVCVLPVLPVRAGTSNAVQVLGYQLDVSRNKVPTMETVFRMVDVLAGLGYNQFQLYTEHTFAYSGHEEAWHGCSPMTPDEIRRLDDYCGRRSVP